MSRAGPAASATTKVGRNDPCPCGSGKKFKQCCRRNDTGSDSRTGTNNRSRPSPAEIQRLTALFRAAKRHWDAGRWSDAIPALREIVRLDPNSSQAHHDLGVAYLRCGRLGEAATSLRRAVELRPGFDRALRHLVDALEPQGHESEVLDVCRRLSRTADDPLERRHFLGKALVLEGKLEEAEKEFRRVLALAPHQAGTRVLLGHALAGRGMFDEAFTQLTKAVEAFPSAFQQLTETRRMTEADRPLVERMRALVERPGLDVVSRLSVLFGLGKALDDLGDYAEAMRHYLEANRLRGISARLDRARLVAEIDNLITSFTAEALQRAGESLERPAYPGDDAPVFVVGMPRSGTTLVEQILSSHPAVAGGGELGFWNDRLSGWFASRLRRLDRDELAKTAEDYRAILRKIGPHSARVIDKAPNNFKRLWLIRLALPAARIIHCRRSPVDTCLSIFFTNFLGQHDYAWDRGDLAFYYRQYERLMDHWRRVLPPERFTEIDYEKLVSDREAETRRLIDFLGLEWDDACLAPERNNRLVSTASLWQARQPVYKTSVERWRRYEPWLGELRELLPASEASAS